MATKKQYTAKEKQAYHNKLSKPGATIRVKNKETGKMETRKVSDFGRGVHKAKADQICKARMRKWKQHHNG